MTVLSVRENMDNYGWSLIQLLCCVGEDYGAKPLMIIIFDHFTPYEDPNSRGIPRANPCE